VVALATRRPAPVVGPPAAAASVLEVAVVTAAAASPREVAAASGGIVRTAVGRRIEMRIRSRLVPPLLRPIPCSLPVASVVSRLRLTVAVRAFAAGAAAATAAAAARLRGSAWPRRVLRGDGFYYVVCIHFVTHFLTVVNTFKTC
jgi:hypothetical protein